MRVLIRKVSAHCQDHVTVGLVRSLLVPQVIDQIIRLFVLIRAHYILIYIITFVRYTVAYVFAARSVTGC